MVLSRPEILAAVGSGRVGFDPPLRMPEAVDQVSIDLRIGDEYTTFRPLPGHIPSICVDSSLFTDERLWRTVRADTYLLAPEAFVLAKTYERVTIPNDLVGFVEGRSSFARVGITVHVTAPKIDPGFSGTVTLEMRNVGTVPVMLRSRIDKPCQLVLMRLTSPIPATEVYGTRATDIFQGQSSPLPFSPP